MCSVRQLYGHSTRSNTLLQMSRAALSHNTYNCSFTCSYMLLLTCPSMCCLLPTNCGRWPNTQLLVRLPSAPTGALPSPYCKPAASGPDATDSMLLLCGSSCCSRLLQLPWLYAPCPLVQLKKPGESLAKSLGLLFAAEASPLAAAAPAPPAAALAPRPNPPVTPVTPPASLLLHLLLSSAAADRTPSPSFGRCFSICCDPCEARLLLLPLLRCEGLFLIHGTLLRKLLILLLIELSFKPPGPHTPVGGANISPPGFRCRPCRRLLCASYTNRGLSRPLQFEGHQAIGGAAVTQRSLAQQQQPLQASISAAGPGGGGR
jgi:hypothetical protein